MNTTQAMDLLVRLLETTLLAVGPLLVVALVAGVLVGVFQTATQINEASISFLVKVLALVVAGVTLGPMLARHVLDYTKATYAQIGNVTR